MKKFLRVLVPLILIFALLAFSAWYFMVYDRELTKEMLLDGARACESNGYHQAASWLYDLAYFQSGSEDHIAIELANQYISSGNFTKAEYTLSKAIASNPTAKLYAELCRLYVQQDKLMDAVAILDTVSSSDIRAELDLMRPEIPAVTPEESFYNQFIDVMVLSNSGTVYVTTDGTYPSLASGAFQEPIRLPEGETVIYALCVSPDNLVSRLGVFGYTVGGIIEAVEFADPSMEAEVRGLLELAGDTPIFSNDLWSITDLSVPLDVTVYSDLTYFPNLQRLVMEGVSEDALSYLPSLKNLTELHLSRCSISKDHLTSIAGLPFLKMLTLRNCGLTSVSGLGAAQHLTYLDLSENTLRNLAPISGMTSLEELYLSNNALTDLKELANMKQLRILNVDYNSLTSADAISGLQNLQQLSIGHNKLYNLGSIEKLTGLTHLDISYNRLRDIQALETCTQIQELDISNNFIADITMLSSLTQLTKLYFAHNTVTALPVFSKDCPLITIDGSHNLLVSVAELSELSALNNVLMDYNPDLEDVTPLDSCPVLVKLNAYGTSVKNVEFLLDKSVIVNYNPVQDTD